MAFSAPFASLPDLQVNAPSCATRAVHAASAQLARALYYRSPLFAGNPTYASRYKVVSDPVHKHITLDDAVLSIIDTPEFQRLRDVSTSERRPAPCCEAASIPARLRLVC